MTLAEIVYEKLKKAPESLSQEVLAFLNRRDPDGSARNSLESRHLTEFVGILKGSATFEGDPVEIQRRIRDRWD